MNNVKIISSYCSEAIVYYLMKNVLQNINVTNLSIADSIVGGEGMFVFMNHGALKDSDVQGISEQKFVKGEVKRIYFPPSTLNLEFITIKNSCTGQNTIFVLKLPNINLNNISLSDIQDCGVEHIKHLIILFKVNCSDWYLANINTEYEVPDLSCNEMISIFNSGNANLTNIFISNIFCEQESAALGILFQKITGIAILNNINITNLSGSTYSGIAFAAKKTETLLLTNISFYNVSNIYGSITQFDDCKSVIIDSLKLNLASSPSSGLFKVFNVSSFILKNFNFRKTSSQFNNGGGLNLLSGPLGSTYIIKSGSFIECSAYVGKGGAIYLDSISALSETLIQIENVDIDKCEALEGSAIYISRNVNFNKEVISSLNNLRISNNTCE